jgi:hypothetical protein
MRRRRPVHRVSSTRHHPRTGRKRYQRLNYVSNCTVSGGGLTWSGITAGCGTTSCTSGSTGKTTNTISQQTTFTLTCTALLDGSATTSSAMVNILPVFREI